MDLLTNASLLQDSIKFVSETKLKQNLSNKRRRIIDSKVTFKDLQKIIQITNQQNNNTTKLF